MSPRSCFLFALGGLLVATAAPSCADTPLGQPPPAELSTSSSAQSGSGATGSGGSGGSNGTGGAAGAGGSGGGAIPQGVMMQAFYMNVPQSTPDGTWWQNLGAKAGELAQAGITAVWIPPPYKGIGGIQGNGYGVYDRYDLGEFDQKGSVATRFGTRAQLDAAVAALHGAGLAVYGDVVMNHNFGADATEYIAALSTNVWVSFTFPGRNGKYSSFTWHQGNFNGCNQGGWKQWHAWDFAPYDNGDAYDNLMGCEIRYQDASTRAEMIAWGKWFTETLALDGYRLDATKHILTSFVNEWLDAVKGDRFAVSEYWSGNVPSLLGYLDATGGRTHLFDVPLHYAFTDMAKGNGGYDMRKLRGAGLTSQRPGLSVSFVENHDTDDQNGSLYSPVTSLKALAYAYILMRDGGYPCVYYRDFYEYNLGDEIEKLIAIRGAHAFGPGAESDASDQDVYAYTRAGDATHTGLVLLLNDGFSSASRQLSTPFKSATLVDATGHTQGEVTTDAAGKGTFSVPGRGYSIWVPK
jgi:alpha-amylase